MELSKSHLYKYQEGFTLIEVMISITILSFITLSTYQMVDSNIDTKNRVLKEDRQTVQALTTTGRLDSDISQIYNPLFAFSKVAPTAANADDVYADTSTANGSFDGKTNNGSLIPQFKSEDKSSLIFFTQANRRKMLDAKESRYAWIKYSLRNMEADPENPDEKISGLSELIRQTINTDIYTQTLDWDKAKAQVVMEKIKSLEFFFWDERTKKYTNSLQELNENKNLIRSLRVNITWIDDDNNEQKIEKSFRVLNPYFNTKQDSLNAGPGGAYNGGAVPPGVSNPLKPEDGNVVQ